MTILKHLTMVISTLVPLLAAVPALDASQNTNVDIYTKSDVKEVIQRIERHGDEFKNHFKKALNNSALYFSDSERDRVKNWAEDLENTVDDLKEEYNEKDFEKARRKLESALMIASGINRFMLRNYFSEDARRSWEILRDDLNVLAVAYNLPVLSNLVVTHIIR